VEVGAMEVEEDPTELKDNENEVLGLTGTELAGA